MADYLPKYMGHAITMTASAAVEGGRLVALTGPYQVATAAANSPSIVGVAGFDAGAGERVTVYTRAGGVHPLIAGAAVAAGARVASTTGGRVQTAVAGDNVIGTAITGGATGATVEVMF
ncbi:capsid cement protein [Microbacterium sp. P04]|uniref:capsid cement protein n=1 Tax=Microbacterium sp. P04 TaxID=3366947 RepID=UPI0037455DF7